MMNKPPAIQFYPDKWNQHTRHLSDSAYRIYHQIILWMWEHDPSGGSISRKTEVIAVLLAYPHEQIVEAMGEIQNPHLKLMHEDGDKLVCKFLIQQRIDINERRKQAELAAHKRWKNHTSAMHPHSDRNATASIQHMPNACGPASSPQCTPTPTPAPIPAPTPIRTPKKIKMRIYTSEFLEFWKLYPRKRSKGKALDAWLAHGCESVLADVMDGLKRHLVCDDWKNSGGKFIPYPATWLNGECWLDEPQQGYQPKERP